MKIFSDAKNFGLFLWNWYVVRPWVSFFPPKPADKAKSADQGQTLHED